ncbi:unnamed protein product [Paramecium pentaurelia]|uniref:non-specific serine/threonine protein kinase n=1 Tax=Paramecium pentaurelia TaxID=43138 RepID=A0A8S1T372_9CILI|nr:unnamed protein product [Paramecium pentaurelia]
MQQIKKIDLVRNSSKNKSFQEIYEFNKCDKLGQGSYGMVYKAVHRATGLSRAVKIIQKASVNQQERLNNELRTVELLDHPHIIRVFETYEDMEYIYVVMEICKGGDIFDKVLEYGNFDEQGALTIFIQIIRSVVYYQSLNIVHRDLKPENFLFQKNNDLDSLYIIDFGLARVFQPGIQYQWTKAGTAYYVAPEVLQGTYDNRCDIWSIGVILYVLLCGYPPFYGENEHEILLSIQKGKFDFDGPEWKNVSMEVKQLICQILQPKIQRIDLKTILKHLWVQKYVQKGEILLTKYHVDRWKQYHILKQIGLLYLSTQLDQSEILEIKNGFLFMNRSQSGILSKEEINFLDDEFQTLEYYQFISLCLEPIIYKNEKYQKLMFVHLSIDGRITTNSLRSIQIYLECDMDYQQFVNLF